MQLAVDKLSALRALRAFRRSGRSLSAERHEPPVPDPSPQRRWTARALPLERLALLAPPDADHPVDVATPSPEARPRAACLSCTVRSSLPEPSFVDLGDGLFIPSPELLFFELADVLSFEAHALLGYELCGAYARDPQDPRLGEAAFCLEPVTSVERISAFLDLLGDRPRARLARRALRQVADNAWSPMEAVIALMAQLPVDELGYELGRVRLNVRHDAPAELVAAGARASRVPDVEVEGTRVGFNYDSSIHFELGSIGSAAEAGGDVAEAVRQVHEKYRDDIRRNRELAAQGRTILPVTAQDLFERGGLDMVMLEAAMAMEPDDRGAALRNVRVALFGKTVRRRRQLMLWSLLPWEEGAVWAQELGKSRPSAGGALL